MKRKCSNSLIITTKIIIRKKANKNKSYLINIKLNARGHTVTPLLCFCDIIIKVQIVITYNFNLMNETKNSAIIKQINTSQFDDKIIKCNPDDKLGIIMTILETLIQNKPKTLFPIN